MFSEKMYFNHIYQCLDNILSKQKFISMSVWYNTNICVSNKTIYVKLWYEYDVKIISDFLNKDGNFLSQHDFEKKHVAWQMFVQCNIIVLLVQNLSFSKPCS